MAKMKKKMMMAGGKGVKKKMMAGGKMVKKMMAGGKTKKGYAMGKTRVHEEFYRVSRRFFTRDGYSCNNNAE